MSLMEDALEDSPKAEIEGIFAAVTIFESPMFQSLKVYEFPELLRLLQNETVLHRQSSVLLMERLRNTTAWSERVQSDFDSIVKHSSKAQHIDNSDEMRGSTMRVRDAMPSQQPLLQDPPAAHCRHPLGIASVGGSSNTNEYRQEASHRIRFTEDGVATSRSTQRCDTSGLESEGNLRPSTNPGMPGSPNARYLRPCRLPRRIEVSSAVRPIDSDPHNYWPGNVRF
ncbi:hypothetical protein N7540_010961 [Penicillium herquei]|nr:hypothetical protein N7540_010961 [Penicillium herquei]